MNPQEIKDFLKSIRDTDIEELCYESGEDYLFLKKSNVEAIVPAAKTKEKEVLAKEKPSVPKSTVITIKSTMVGTFSIAPNNDKPPFVMEGDSVKPGQKVGQIEAMKIIKDVHSNASGKIVKIAVSNGQSVEYGQDLFLIDTSK
jgi:acetyl-CoA carboxylase biotin carboxyl carrier protein